MTITNGPTARVDQHPVRRRFGRRKFDKQPTQQCAVLIATEGLPVPASVLNKAVGLSDGSPVAVVTVARIYGSSLGLPNPGLMPTRREMADHKALVEKVVRAVERKGCEAWGQIAASRRPAKTIAEVAAARGVQHVILVEPGKPRWRQVVEGDLVKDISRKLGSQVHVEGIRP